MQYRRALITFATLLVAATGPRVAAAQTPSPGQDNQQNVARLQNFGTLVSFLNLAAGAVRLVVVLEPSSPSSVESLNTLAAVLETNASKRFRAYVVLSNVSPEDTEARALALANQLHDRRVVYFWDPEAVVSDSFRSVVGSGGTPATGVFLLYDTDARLALTPPPPSLMMSANPGIKGPAVDAKQLATAANAMVRVVEEKAIDAAAPKQ